MCRISLVVGREKEALIVEKGEMIIFVRVEGYGRVDTDEVKETIIGVHLKTEKEIKEILREKGYNADSREEVLKSVKEIVGESKTKEIEEKYFIEEIEEKEDWKTIKKYLFNK